MRKIITLLALLAVAALRFTACGDSSTSTSADAGGSTSTEAPLDEQVEQTDMGDQATEVLQIAREAMDLQNRITSLSVNDMATACALGPRLKGKADRMHELTTELADADAVPADTIDEAMRLVDEGIAMQEASCSVLSLR